jgi:hypothetical protein
MVDLTGYRFDEPYVIQLQGYNLAIDWQHTIELSVEYQPVKAFYHGSRA